MNTFEFHVRNLKPASETSDTDDGITSDMRVRVSLYTT
jgi:hypothetical protein